jgi:hypothetical protein
MNINSENIRKLEEFLVNNKDLENLEALISKFNIFEAVGAIRLELRHSDFLSFILSPRENHGLKELFLKKLLQKASMVFSGEIINVIEIDTANYDLVEVKREVNNIDILIYIPSIPLVCAIENKIFSGEHSDQLGRYKKYIQKEYPNCKQIFIYLTPDGLDPSDEDWLPFGYNLLAEILNNILDSAHSTLANDIHTLIKHYIAMLERHIITDSQIAELCRKIYNSHRKAIDLIIEHRPDTLGEVSDHIIKLIQSVDEPKLQLDEHPKRYIRFAPEEWDKLTFQQETGNWTSSKRILLFVFHNSENSLSLKLIIGPGEEAIRSKLFYHAEKHGQNLPGCLNKLTHKWTQIYSYDFIKKKDYAELIDAETLFERIDMKWKKFVEDDLKIITSIISELKD